MTGRQLSAKLLALDITSHYAAQRVLGISRSSIIRYVHGHTVIPTHVERYLLMLERYGIPKEWRDA
jgi:hypothetical protein